MKKPIRITLLILLPFFLLLINETFSLQSVPLGEFSVTPSQITLNWKNDYRENINLTVNTNYSTKIKILNGTTNIKGIYGQEEVYDRSQFPCFKFAGIPLLVRNASSGELTNETNPMLQGDSENFTLIFSIMCPPGRYEGFLNLTNATNSSEWLNLSVTIDVSVKDNVMNYSKGVATIYGKFKKGSTYHSYFFNTSEIENSTGVFIDLHVDGSEDLDLFVFDSHQDLLDKSISRVEDDKIFLFQEQGPMASSASIWICHP